MEKQYYFQTKHMTVGYGGVPLIRNVEIALEQGEILTLIGPNGAGKSTILKSIAGQLIPVEGEAVWKVSLCRRWMDIPDRRRWQSCSQTV